VLSAHGWNPSRQIEIYVQVTVKVLADLSKGQEFNNLDWPLGDVLGED